MKLVARFSLGFLSGGDVGVSPCFAANTVSLGFPSLGFICFLCTAGDGVGV
jgi:hypothetical protein